MELTAPISTKTFIASSGVFVFASAKDAAAFANRLMSLGLLIDANPVALDIYSSYQAPGTERTASRGSSRRTPIPKKSSIRSCRQISKNFQEYLSFDFHNGSSSTAPPMSRRFFTECEKYRRNARGEARAGRSIRWSTTHATFRLRCQYPQKSTLGPFAPTSSTTRANWPPLSCRRRSSRNEAPCA